MKKFALSLLLTGALSFGLFTGCAGGSAQSAAETAADTQVAETADTQSETGGEEAVQQETETEASAEAQTPAADESSVSENADAAQEQVSAGESVTVNVGDQAAFFLVKVAQEKGFFEEEFAADGITINSEIFAKMGPAIIEAMATGDVDLSIVGVFPVVNANNAGNEIKILASGNYTEDGFRLVAGPDSKIDSVEGLKGLKVGVPFGAAEHQITLQILEKHSLSDVDVELVNLQQADALTALVGGEIDAALFNSGTLSAAEEAGCKVLATNKEIGLIVNPVIGRKDFVEANPEITSRFLKVLDKTAKWIDENEDEAVAIAAAVNGTDEESTRVSLLSRGRTISIADEYLKNPVEDTLNFATSQGMISDMSYEDIVDTSYFENAGIE